MDGEKVMHRTNTRSNIRLAVKKETLKDLSASKPVGGGRMTLTR